MKGKYTLQPKSVGRMKWVWRIAPLMFGVVIAPLLPTWWSCVLIGFPLAALFHVMQFMYEDPFQWGPK